MWSDNETACLGALVVVLIYIVLCMVEVGLI